MVKHLIGYDVELTNGFTTNVDIVSSTSYSIAPVSGSHPYYIAVDSSGGAVTVNLPVTENNGLEVGRMYNILDYKGYALTNNITISTSSGTINGETTTKISNNYESLTLLCTSISPIIWNIV